LTRKNVTRVVFYRLPEKKNKPIFYGILFYFIFCPPKENVWSILRRDPSLRYFITGDSLAREDDVNDATLLFTESFTLAGVLLVSHHFYTKTKAEDNRNGARRRPTQTQTIELRLDLKWKKLYWPAEAAEAMAIRQLLSDVISSPVSRCPITLYILYSGPDSSFYPSAAARSLI
jgi:hypothetical protein